MSKKIVIYTAVFGNNNNYDAISCNFPGFDFICFTDKKIESSKWKIKLVKVDLSPEVLNRKYKILANKYLRKYDVSLYIDANIKILKNPKNFITKALKKSDFIVSKHFMRRCVYDEAYALLRSSRFNNYIIFKQILKYAIEGMPKNYGLSENSIIIRRHNKLEVKNIMNKWWKEIVRHSHRDQLSLAYVCWRNRFNLSMTSEDKRKKNFFSFSEKKYKNKGLFNLLKSLFWIFLYFIFIRIILRIGSAKNVNRLHSNSV
jgi:hypothetical protein